MYRKRVRPHYASSAAAHAPDPEVATCCRIYCTGGLAGGCTGGLVCRAGGVWAIPMPVDIRRIVALSVSLLRIGMLPGYRSNAFPDGAFDP